jgi:hypothetical protein
LIHSEGADISTVDKDGYFLSNLIRTEIVSYREINTVTGPQRSDNNDKDNQHRDRGERAYYHTPRVPSSALLPPVLMYGLYGRPFLDSFCLIARLIGRRGSWDPGVAVVIVPFSGLTVFRPPATSGILHHDLRELGVEFLGTKAAVIVLLLEIGIAAVCFLEIDLKPPSPLVRLSLIWKILGLVGFRLLLTGQKIRFRLLTRQKT